METSDVVVVGSGGAGMMAALRFYVDCERPDYKTTFPGAADAGRLGPAVTFGHVAAKSVLAEGGRSL